jgi:hypothetical protein
LICLLKTFETPHPFGDKWAALAQDIGHSLHGIKEHDIHLGFATAAHHFHRQSRFLRHDGEE